MHNAKLRKTLAIDSQAVIAAVERTVQEFGGIEILVNNAGVASMASIDAFSLGEFDRTFAINVRAVFVANRYARAIWGRGDVAW